MATKTAKKTTKTTKAKAKVSVKTKAKAAVKKAAKKTPKKIQDLAKKAAAKKKSSSQAKSVAKVAKKTTATKKPTVKSKASAAAKAKKAVTNAKKASPKKATKVATHPTAKPRPANDTMVKGDSKFSKGDPVVYPAHGVGVIEGIETQTIGGMEVKLYVVTFEKDRMRLKIPLFKAEASGLRKVRGGEQLDNALKTLKGRSRIKRMMWSRRAQEYEMKINSGDPIAIAEVLRDLKRSNDDSEQSYSERQIYQSALERLAREVAIVDKTSEEKAAERIEKLMGKKKPAQQVAA